MANRFAIANTNFDNTATWSTTPGGVGGASIPTIGDNAIANNRTVTISANAICDWILNDTTGGATGGGGFSLGSGVTLTANVSAGIVIVCLSYSGIGTSNIIGNIYAGTGNNTRGVSNNSTGTLNITGNAFGPPTGVNQPAAVYNASNGIINFVGNAIGGGQSSGWGLWNTSTGTINVTGNVIGGTAAAGANNAGVGTISIFGTASASNFTNGATNTSTGLLYITKVVGNNFGLGTVGVNSVVGASNTQNGRMYVEQVEFGPRGQTPISGPVYIIPSNRNTLTGVLTALGNTVTFYNSLSVNGLLPPVSSVRLGTVYNVGNSVGTMAVPSASAVEFGVPVDNTVGVAALTPQNVWGYSKLSATDVGSMGDRLRNTATAQSVGSQIASFNL
jgi:hypothetical protein